MAASSVLAFWFVALLLIVVPGADWAFTIGAALRGRAVLPAVSGLIIGYAIITAVVAAGVGALVAGSPALLTGLTTVGGAYLMWHGATTLARPSRVATAGEAPAGTNLAILIKGVGVSGLNPKGLLIFLALLPQFANPHWSWPLPVQICVLGLAFVLTCAAFYLSLGTFARAVLHSRPAAARAVSRFSGAAMLIIGATLIVDRVLG
jgi:threonine/homoserine/homoserine lactone efflux protein